MIVIIMLIAYYLNHRGGGQVEKDKLNFSEVVKQAIHSKGIKSKELAGMTGYSAAYISDLLSGERRWNEDSIDKVCRALGVQINFEPMEQIENIDESSEV
jgi:transcriptional regulator with XRE-family HTH domain